MSEHTACSSLLSRVCPDGVCLCYRLEASLSQKLSSTLQASTVDVRPDLPGQRSEARVLGGRRPSWRRAGATDLSGNHTDLSLGELSTLRSVSSPGSGPSKVLSEADELTIKQEQQFLEEK